MGPVELNPHWESMARAGQWDPLVAAIQVWLDQYAEQLASWAELTFDWAAEAEALRQLLMTIDPAAEIHDWGSLSARLAQLQHQGHELKEAYLVHLGPTPLACLNAVPHLLDRLYDRAETGSAIFDEVARFEQWAHMHQVHGEACDRLKTWIEDQALELLRGSSRQVQGLRAELAGLWQELEEDHRRRSQDEALSGPTGSQRWNSWLLMLEQSSDASQVCQTLEQVDEEVDEVARALPEAVELAEEYFELSDQLRAVLETGRVPAGWSQVLAPVLVDLDALVPRQSEALAPTHRVRSLCDEFEAGHLSTEAFQARLLELSQSLAESRKRSRIQAAQHPDEAAFVEALGKLQGGLDILSSVEQSSQASRLQMGCTLIEDALAQIQQLETEHGR